MALSLYTNLASLRTMRALDRSNARVPKHIERLSTGLRVNSGADDAAGLAIGERFTSQIRGLKQGLRNTNDGVSLVQTAEAAMAEIANLSQRIRVLAVQAASDSNTLNDRLLLQEEAEQAITEIRRITRETTFNGKTLLDGSFMDATFQVGANQGDTIEVDIRDLSRIGATASVTSVVGAAMANPLAAGDLTINGFVVPATSPTDDGVSTLLPASSAIAKANAINRILAKTDVIATAGPTVRVGNPVAGGFVPFGALRINTVPIASVVVQPGDANGALRAAINAVSDRTGVVATLDDTGRIVLTAEDGRNIFVLATPIARIRTGILPGVSLGAITLTSDYGFSIGGANPDNAGFTAGYYGLEGGLDQVDLTTRRAASASIRIMDIAVRQVSRERARMGAVLSRFDAVLNAQAAAVESQSAARSQIMDADVAKETAGLLSHQILARAAASLLAQANTRADQVRTLLSATPYALAGAR